MARDQTRVDAAVWAKGYPHTGRYVRRVVANPRQYTGEAQRKRYGEVKSICALQGLSDDQFDVIWTLCTAFLAAGREEGRRGL